VIESEERLLALLNSAPVIDGSIVETLEDPLLIALRNDLQAVIRGEAPPTILEPHLTGVSRRPEVTGLGVAWTLDGPDDALQRAELVVEWDRVHRELPNRLRPCANPECTKFLIDHSRPNTARWCSMSECGNRMKARRHYARQLTARH
jgi:hypothetical protein